MENYLKGPLSNRERWGGRIDYVELLDTTLRDGSQTRGVTFTLHDKVRVAQLLDELGIDIIEAGWPGSNPKDSAVFTALKEAGLSRSRVAAFGSTRRKEVRAEQDRSLGGRLPSKLLDYMASGRPIVATNVDESFPLKESGAGIVTEIDAEAIAESVIRLLDDDRLSEELARKGVECAQKYEWSNIVEQYVKLFYQVYNSQ